MVDLKPHNLETYEKIKEIFKTSNRACVVQPTGSGKSYLALKLFEDNPSVKKLVLEPQHYIREQLQAKVTENMGEVQFITYSKLAKMSDEDIVALKPDIIVLDEFHRAGAKEWGGKGVKRLLEFYPVCKVLGLSATPIRYLDNGRNMAEELFDGAMANNISLSEAIVQRILPMPRYICGLYCLNGEVESINKKIEQSYNNPEEKKTLLKQVQEMKKQLDKSNGVSSILHKYILEPDSKYIVFCKDIKHLYQMKPMLEQWFVEAGFKDVRMYIVHSKNENKDAEFIKFKEDDDEGIRLCLTVSMLNEGVHVDGIDGVIMLRNTISAGLFLQQIGRAISCNSKGIPLILDLVANAQSITECNLKTDIEREIQKERERKRGFSGEGLDVDKFFIMDEVLDVISAFKGIEGRLVDSWDTYIKALEQFKEREGNCMIPAKHLEVLENGTRVSLGSWVNGVRRTKDGKCNDYVLTDVKIGELDSLSFIWDIYKYRFEIKVNRCIEFYQRKGKLPSEYSKNKEERELGIFIQNSKHKAIHDETYSQWRVELLSLIPGIYEKKGTMIDIFCEMASVYKEKYGNLNIKTDDTIDGYNIGSIYNALKGKRKNGELTDLQIEKIEKLGINLDRHSNQERFEKNIRLAYQCVREKKIITRSDCYYQGVNLYEWAIRNVENITKVDRTILSKLIHNSNLKPVNVIDAKTNKILCIYPSISDTCIRLSQDYSINKISKTSIKNQLSGKTTKPYKGRFIFQYADTDHSEPA